MQVKREHLERCEVVIKAAGLAGMAMVQDAAKRRAGMVRMERTSRVDEEASGFATPCASGIRLFSRPLAPCC